MKDICVVHLVRAANDMSYFRRFLDSYRAHPGGVEHDFMILFKGFESAADKQPYLELLSGVPHRTFDVSDEGFDINAYYKVADTYGGEYRYFCFLNSHSMILDDGWLAKLYHHAAQDDVGLVGASGSWQSHRGAHSVLRMVMSIANYFGRALCANTSLSLKMEQMNEVIKEFVYLLNYDRYPNVHVRTNAFMVASSTFGMVDGRSIRTKRDAYIYESGKHGLSKVVMDSGKKLLIVGRDGLGYEPQAWSTSKIYWNGEQENLLVSDNVTRQYELATLEGRAKLAEIAWEVDDPDTLVDRWEGVANAKYYAEKIRLQQERLRTLDSGAEASGVRVLIYGAGVLGDAFDKWLRANTRNIEIVGFVDTYLTSTVFHGAQVHSPGYLVDPAAMYDYVLISSNKFYHEIFAQLREMNVDTSKII